MDWDRREGVTAGGLKGLGLELEVGVELLVDDGCDAEFDAELCQELTEDAITMLMEALDFPPGPGRRSRT